MPDAIRIGPIPIGQGTAAKIRAAMLGGAQEGIRVVRQAWRISERDSDELALLSVNDRSWWVAQRLSDQLSVWAFPGDDEAASGFERLMTQGSGSWHESDTSLAG